jgi:hypothetical protein
MRVFTSREVTLLAVVALAASCQREAPAQTASTQAPTTSPAAAAPAPAVAAPAPAAATPAPAAATSAQDATTPPAATTPSIQIAYIEPKEAAHRRLYDIVRERRVLEQAAEALSVVHLPKPLTLEFTGCDGDSNAYYEDTSRSIKFCYEFLADIARKARKTSVDGKTVAFPGSKVRIPLQEAIDGPVVFVLFHESGHAVYDLLKVPVLGREEDAADNFAAIALLRLGNEVAMRYLRGAAWAYARGATTTKVDVSDFSDSHSLDSQRYFNILCMAYGSDPEYFKVAVTHGKLPPERAEDCGWEYRQARYALQKLVMPSIDQQQLEYVRMKARKAVSESPSPGASRK